MPQKSATDHHHPAPLTGRIAWLRLLGLILLATCGARDRHAFLGSGRPTPEAAWVTWVDAVATQDYHLVRQVVRYSGPECGGMEMIALNPHDPSAISRYLADHIDHAPQSMGNVDGPLYHHQQRDTRFAELWDQRIAPFRGAILPYLTHFRAATLQPIDADTWAVVYPRARYDQDRNLLGFDPNLPNEIRIQRHGNAWFVTDFTCHAMNESPRYSPKTTQP
ncbi:hypothetical protein [Acanthopleuribacter pedis]|uniref:Uncharacterized protein n=1 Tax=Acanthopleuribacter pedis TaxID=442870 RepID=A0A8J7QBV8_9BACT|nr:hypothetical protein [Acanthopleuribacter pedis]MBO1323272.1 hypothetical protein [Acanthopleuribacter pedis]